MKRKFTLVFLFLGSTLFGQEFGFDIHKISLDQYIHTEEKLDSERIPAVFNFVSFTGDAVPIQFIREENVIPDMVSNYFFKAKDSTINSLLYEWDEKRRFIKANFRDTNKEEIQRGLRRKFYDLEKRITQEYGEPIAEKNISGLAQDNLKAGILKKYNWYPNDSTEIRLSADFYYNKIFTTTRPLLRIRLYVWNTKIEKEESRLDTLVSLSKEFMQVLSEKDIARSREYFSDSINENLANHQVERLINNFNFKRETSLLSGSQSKYEGKVLSMLKFGHKNDTLNSLGETIIIIFDSKNNIIGIKQAKGK